MKFKNSESEGWFYKIDDEGKRSPSFSNRGEIGKRMFSDMQKWVSEGNEIEAQYTAEELTVKEQDDIAQKQKSNNNDAREFLNDTDWKITRHNEQLTSGVGTSLTSDEFSTLLADRQEKRDSIIE